MDKPQHTYPSGCDPSTGRLFTEAWGILDTFTPGALSDEIRYFLAGMIMGTLARCLQQQYQQHVTLVAAAQAVLNEWHEGDNLLHYADEFSDRISALRQALAALGQAQQQPPAPEGAV